MNKHIITVPTGIKYISEWKEYSLPEGHCIVDKGVTGCGYTEYGLRNNCNVILCSPRKMLLENKRKQHLGDENILYLENAVEKYDDIISLNTTISDHIIKCRTKDKPVKFMITYDSSHYLIDYLKNNNLLDKFYIIADEFQSIFLDSYFKADVENSFLRSIQICPNIIYLSATPMLDKYLNMLDEFKDLNYYFIDWSKSGYIENLRIQRKQTTSLGSEINRIIRDYLSGEFPIMVDKTNKVVVSNEAVFYFNSISEIKRAISNNNLNKDQVNILCAKTEKNRAALRKIGMEFGDIPLEGEPHKMFTFCTSTCYIGADFYSKCASTYIFADPNLECLALDISLDLPQIAGRQRNRENPFKNNITIFYKTTRNENIVSRQRFDDLQKARKRATMILLEDYNKLSIEGKKLIIDKYVSDVEVNNYLRDFLGIFRDDFGAKPVYNKLIEIANERAWEVSQKDYQDSINVTRALSSIRTAENYPEEYKTRDDKIIDEFLSKRFFSTGVFDKKLEVFCEFMDNHKNNFYILERLDYKISDPIYYSCYRFYGTDGCRALKFRKLNLLQGMLNETKGSTLQKSVIDQFIVGERYSLKDLKTQLTEIYRKLEIIKIPKATDIEEWFEIKNVQIYDSLTKKKVNGFELLKRK